MADTAEAVPVELVAAAEVVQPAPIVAEAVVEGMEVVENALKRPADDVEDGPDAKRLHVEQEEAGPVNGVPAADVAAAEAPFPAADQGQVAAGVQEIKQEDGQPAAEFASEQPPPADAVPAAQPDVQQAGQDDAVLAAQGEDAAAPREAQPEGGQEAPAGEGEAAAAAAAAGGDPDSPGQHGGRPSAGIELGSFRLPADAILKQDIPLPRRMASCVIGIKGQSVSKLRRESGSKIHIRPAAGRDELDQVVEIEGSIESVLTCVRMVADLLRAEDPAYKMSPKPHVTSRFLVLPEMIGPAIIGKGGTHAKHIKERTGVRIEVIPAQAATQSRQEIVLHGPPERVREAYHLLLGNIRKYGPANLPAGAVPNPLPFPSRGRGGEAPPPWRSGPRDPYSPGSRGGPYGGPPGGGRGPPPPPPPPRGGAPPPYRYEYAPPAAYPAADPYRAPAPAAAPYAAQPAAAAAAATAYQPAAADPNAAAATAAAGGQQQMMYILQDGVLKPLTVMYQQGTTAAAVPAAAPVAQTTVLPATYATAGTTYGAAAPASTGATNTAGLYQQAATTAGTAQYTYAVPSTDASGNATAGAWTVQQLGGQVAAATSAPMAAAPATYTTAAGYGAQTTTTQYAAPAGTQYYYQPQ